MTQLKGTEDVDSKFDKAERFWERLQKLLLKIVGGVVGITLAIYIAYGQLKDKHAEHFEKEKIEHAEELKKYIDKKESPKKKAIATDHFSPYNDEKHNHNHTQKQEYMLLSRLQSDCEYYLGSGNRNEKELFHGNVREHIQSMKELWIQLEKKPQWLSMKDIIDYERKMKAVVLETDSETETETVEVIDDVIETVTETVTPTVTPTITESVEDEDEDEVEDEVVQTVTQTISQTVEVEDEVEEEIEEEAVVTTPTPTANYTITKKTWIIDPEGERKGDTIYIDYYSDGYIEKYYTDGKTYSPK